MAMKDVKALQGFRGWVTGVLKALDSWEDRLRDVPGDLPDALDGDIAELALCLGRIQGALGKSRLESLAGSVGIVFPAYRRSVTEDDTPPVLAESEEEVDTALAPEASGMLVRAVAAHPAGLRLDALTPVEKRVALALVRSKNLANTDGVLAPTRRGVKRVRALLTAVRSLQVEALDSLALVEGESPLPENVIAAAEAAFKAAAKHLEAVTGMAWTPQGSGPNSEGWHRTLRTADTSEFRLTLDPMSSGVYVSTSLYLNAASPRGGSKDPLDAYDKTFPTGKVEQALASIPDAVKASATQKLQATKRRGNFQKLAGEHIQRLVAAVKALLPEGWDVEAFGPSFTGDLEMSATLNFKGLDWKNSRSEHTKLARKLLVAADKKTVPRGVVLTISSRPGVWSVGEYSLNVVIASDGD